MTHIAVLRLASSIAASMAIFILTSPALDGGGLPGDASQRIIAEGTYVYSAGTSETRENWTLSKTAAGAFIVEGTGAYPDSGSQFLNYRIEMDEALHPTLIELHTTADLPSYTCKLTQTTARCVVAFEPPNPETRGEQNADLKAPFDLFGFHSCGWIVASIVQRLPPGQSQVTVRLFLPSEERYPDAVAEVTRLPSGTIALNGKSFEAQRYALKLIMGPGETSAFTVWASRSGLILKVQPDGESASADLPAMEMPHFKQTEGFVPELPH